MLGKLVPAPLEEIGLLLQDAIRDYRFKNQVNMLMRTEEFLEQKGLSPRVLPLKLVYNLLDKASLEDDPDLQGRWAALLANALDPNYEVNWFPTFSHILSQLTPVECRVLDQLHRISSYEVERNVWEPIEDAVVASLGITSETYAVAESNLIRLNLIDIPGRTDHMGGLGASAVRRSRTEFSLTALGQAFIESCTVKPPDQR